MLCLNNADNVINVRLLTSGVATGWTGVYMSTQRLPEVIPEIDANPVTILGVSGGGGVSVSGSMR